MRFLGWVTDRARRRDLASAADDLLRRGLRVKGSQRLRSLQGARPLEQADNMIVLFTDFGLHGPYTGQMKAVLHRMAPGIPITDLFADAPVANPKSLSGIMIFFDRAF